MKHTHKLFLLLFLFLQGMVIVSPVTIANDHISVSQLFIDTDKDGLLDMEEEKRGTDIKEKDTDKDGYFDGEEVHDYGLHPLQQDDSIFETLQAIRLLSIPESAVVEGTSVFLKGIYFLPNSSFSLNMHSFYGLSKDITVQTDGRGVFHQVVPLDDFCKERGDNRITFTGEMGFSHHITLRCSSDTVEKIIQTPLFEYYPVEFTSKKHFMIAGNLHEGFSAQIPHEYELTGYYSSVVTTAYQLADSMTQRSIAFPSQQLMEGEHTLTLVLRHKITGVFLEPIEIHFTLLADDVFGYLQANSVIVNTFAGISIASFIALLGVLIIGMEKKKNKELRMEIESDY